MAPAFRWRGRFLLCTDESVIGTAFYVMDFVAGRIFWEPHAPGLSGEERRPCSQLNEPTMARLHRLRSRSLGLADFGRPTAMWRARSSAGREQYRASETEKIAAMDRLIAWLPQACPAQIGRSLRAWRFPSRQLHRASKRAAHHRGARLGTVDLGDPARRFHLSSDAVVHAGIGGGLGVGSLIGHENDPGIPALEDYIAQYCQAHRPRRHRRSQHLSRL